MIKDVLTEYNFRTNPELAKLAKDAIGLLKFHKRKTHPNGEGVYLVYFSWSGYPYRIVLQKYVAVPGESLESVVWFLTINDQDFGCSFETKESAVKTLVRMMSTDTISDFAEKVVSHE